MSAWIAAMNYYVFTLLGVFLFCQPLFGQGFEVDEPEESCLIARFEFEGSPKELIQDLPVSPASLTYAGGRLGLSDQSGFFNGSTNQISVNNDNPVILTDEWTINAWAKQSTSGGGTGSQNPIFSQRGDFAAGCCTGDPAINLFSATAAGNAVVVIRPGTGPSVTVSAPAPLDGSWHMYSAVKTLDSLKLFIDGVMVDGIAHSYGSDDFWTGLDYTYIGRHRFSGGNFGQFEGEIDDLRIYDCALSDAEIEERFTGTPCSKPIGLALTLLTSDSAQLVWDRVPAASGYKVQIQRASDGAKITRRSLIARELLTGLDPTETYLWRVRPICNSGTGPVSAVSSFTTPMLRTSGSLVISLFPNPAGEQLHIEFSEQVDGHTVQLINYWGRIVESAELQQRLTFDVKHLEGIHFVRVLDPHGNAVEKLQVLIVR